MIGVVIALAVTCLFLIILLVDARSKVGRQEVRYVDTSGVETNPPKFIDTWKNKTINFDLGKHALKICHLPILENLDIISKMAGHYAVLKHGLDESFKGSKIDKVRAYQLNYIMLTDLLYKLGKPFGKRGFKRAFYKKARENSNFIIGVGEQVFDYWENMGKLLGVLSKGMTPRLVYGESLGSDRLKWDAQGKRLIEPRSDSIMRLKRNGQKESEKKTSE